MTGAERRPGESPVSVPVTGGNRRMESTTPPAWVEFLMSHMDKRFDAQDARLDKLVSRETFRDEQNRLNGIINDMQKDIAANAGDIRAEATARANAELARLRQVNEEARESQAVARQTRWQWFLIPAAPIGVMIVNWLMTGGLQR